MKPDRRSKQYQISETLSKELDGFPGMLRRWGNTALTCVLIAAAVAMLVRWRLASVEQARLAVLNALSNARNYVDKLRPINFINQTPDYIARSRTEISALAKGEIANVLNNTDDAKIKAQAMIVRGDLYWQLANFPDLPGASTQPSLEYPESQDELLKKAADEYNEVLNNSAYNTQHDAVISAHFGLAAIAENKNDWEDAKKQLNQIADDSAALPVLARQARDELSQLPQIQTPLYLLPATTQPLNESATAWSTTAPTTSPSVK